jgi:hypothetical protein
MPIQELPSLPPDEMAHIPLSSAIALVRMIGRALIDVSKSINQASE